MFTALASSSFPAVLLPADRENCEACKINMGIGPLLIEYRVKPARDAPAAPPDAFLHQAERINPMEARLQAKKENKMGA